MKVVTVPVHLLWRLVLLPFKLLFVATGLTFRTGVKVGSLPVKGTRATARALGPKAVVLFALGVVIGVVVGRKMAGDLSPTFVTGSLPEPTPVRPAVAPHAATGGSSVLGDEGGTSEMAEIDAEVAEALGETPGERVADVDPAGGA